MDTVLGIVTIPMINTWGGFETTATIPWCARVHYWFTVDGKRCLQLEETTGTIAGGEKANEFWMPYRGVRDFDNTVQEKPLQTLRSRNILSWLLVWGGILAIIMSYMLVVLYT